MPALYAGRRAATAPTSYVVLIVEPIGEFTPFNFQARPTRYRVIGRIKFPFLGHADSKRFMFNKRAEQLGTVAHRWAIAE